MIPVSFSYHDMGTIRESHLPHIAKKQELINKYKAEAFVYKKITEGKNMLPVIFKVGIELVYFIGCLAFFKEGNNLFGSSNSGIGICFAGLSSHFFRSEENSFRILF